MMIVHNKLEKFLLKVLGVSGGGTTTRFVF